MNRIRKNDEVIVIAGKFKGQRGKVLELNWKQNKVTVDKINIVKKHVKPSQTNPDGGLREFEAPIHLSNVAMALKGKEGVSTKVGFKIKDGKKIRVAKRNGKEI